MSNFGEMVFVDDQEVAYEIEIDHEETLQPVPENLEVPSHFAYEGMEEDRWIDEDGVEYFFDPNTMTYEQTEIKDDRRININYLGKDDEEPSTSNVKRPCVYNLKRTDNNHGQMGEQSISNIAFSTNFTEFVKPSRKSKTRKASTMKAIHYQPIEPESVECMLENGTIIKSLQREISKLQQENEALKKEHEDAHKMLSGIHFVHVDVKRQVRELNHQRGELVRALTRIRMIKKQLIESSVP